jgi:hypothetical protein
MRWKGRASGLCITGGDECTIVVLLAEDGKSGPTKRPSQRISVYQNVSEGESGVKQRPVVPAMAGEGYEVESSAAGSMMASMDPGLRGMRQSGP